MYFAGAHDKLMLFQLCKTIAGYSRMVCHTQGSILGFYTFIKSQC